MTADSVRTRPAGELRGRDQDRGFDEPGLVNSFMDRMRPDEGWVSLALVLVLAGTMAWSIADSRWILGRDDLTSFVIWVAVAAAMWGYISSRLDISPWIAQVTGAAIGAFVVIELVGSLLPGAESGLPGWFQATAGSVAQAYLDLTWRHQIATTQFGHFCLIIGIVIWATVQVASYDVFGYHRGINGVLLMAVILMTNMALLELPHAASQFPDLVLFSAAALGLLLRAHAADERSSWQRHRIWRGGDLKAPQAHSGVGFASAAILGALVLTNVASSAPLANAWSGVSDNFKEFATSISGLLPGGNGSRFGQGADFGSSTVIGSSFQGSTGVVLTIQMPQGAANTHWRVIAYDNFKATGWSAGRGPTENMVQVSSSHEVAMTQGSLDQVNKDSSDRTTFVYTVQVRDTSLRHLVVASEPGTVSIPGTRVLVGAAPADADIVWFPTDATTYTVTSYLPNLDPKGAGLTETRLRAAGSDYPPSLLARYTQGADLVGTAGHALLTKIESAHAKGVAMDQSTGNFLHAYDAAKSIQDFLADSANFTYNTDIRDLVPKCSSLTTVDCFATYKIGFCEQYATTMTMLMRMEGFPARYVEGYLSGPLDKAALTVQMTGQQRHAWVEVYFPSYGWIPFDPTGGSVGQPTRLPVGSPIVASPSPSRSSLQPGGTDLPDPTIRRGGGGTTAPGSSDNGAGGGLLIPAVIILAALLGMLVMWRRRPRRLENPDVVYQGIVRVASRLGYKPLPTQTVFEYTGMLADLVPRARVPLSEVATAQVEVVYGQRRLAADRLISLSAAQRVVRRALLRLVFRLPGRGHRRPPKAIGRDGD
jgi:transglutaminase-like putative cysteine protease